MLLVNELNQSCDFRCLYECRPLLVWSDHIQAVPASHIHEVVVKLVGSDDASAVVGETLHC
jgi:hypothetical protein